MLYDLAMRELKIKEGKGTSDATTMKKILFSLRYGGKPVEVMDTYSKLILSDVQLAKSVNKIFQDHIWAPEWEKIGKKLTYFDTEIQQSTQEMKRILELKYCRYSYKDKLAMCKKIISKLDDDDATEKIVQILKEVHLSVIGTFADISGGDEKEKFLNFLFSVNKDSIKKANKSFVKKIQDRIGSEHAKALENQMKQAIHLYERFIFSTSELGLLHGIVLEIDTLMTEKSENKALINIWKDFKAMHDQCWVGNFLRNWMTKNNLKEKYQEIDATRDEIQTKWQRHCVDGARSRIAEPSRVIRRMDFLLERLLLLTNEYASIDESISIWKELKEVKPQLLEEEIQKRSKTLVDKAGPALHVDSFAGKIAISEDVEDESIIRHLKDLIIENRDLFQRSLRRLYDITNRTVAGLKGIKDNIIRNDLILNLLGLLEDGRASKLSTIGEILQTMPVFQLNLLKSRQTTFGGRREKISGINELVSICSNIYEVVMNKSNDVTFEHWSGSLLEITKTCQNDPTLKELAPFFVQFQSLLIGRRRLDFMQNFSKDANKNENSSLDEEICSQMEMISNFLGESAIEKNNVFLSGLLYLLFTVTERPDDSISMKNILKNFTSCIKLSGLVFKKTKILDFFFSSTNNIESAFVKRWIQSEAACNNKTVAKMYDAVKRVPSTTEQNRFFDLVNDILTQEEKKYKQLLDKERMVVSLKTESPLRYAHVLKREVLNITFHNLARIYFPQLVPQESATIMTDNNPSLVVPYSTEIKSDHDWKQLLNLKNSFKRANFFAKENKMEFEWILWLKDVVIPSLSTFVLPIETVREILIVIEEFSFQELLETTLMSRPNRWLDHSAVLSVMRKATELYGRDSDDGPSTSTHLLSVLRRCPSGRTVMSILRRKLNIEAKAAQKTRLDPEVFKKIVRSLAQLRGEIYRIDRLNASSLSQWPKVIRQMINERLWSVNTALQISRLDARIGVEKTDTFISHCSAILDEENKSERLQIILKNIFKYSWLLEDIAMLKNNPPNDFLEMIQDEESIKQFMENKSKRPLDLEEIQKELEMFSGESRTIRTLMTSTNKTIIQQTEEIKKRRLEFVSYDTSDIEKWAVKAKERSDWDVVEFLSIACQSVKDWKGFYPRDTQLVAVLLFNGSSERGTSSMAQISTGEGKTIITALLAIYLSLRKKFVHVVTSSSVLAEENVVEVKDLCKRFCVNVDNICDQQCSSDENERRNRYKNDIIYGDLSSFQRDLLMTKFFGRDITRNLEPGAIIIDEVDSMLLDKGENILYLSHKIPEFDELLQIFVEIWNAVHAPDVSSGTDDHVAKVLKVIQIRIDSGEIMMPNCIREYVNRQLITLIRNAFRAKNYVTVNDFYKLDDLRDGRGQQLVIMDKETGVEQVQTTWSHGLHQFLQLKHGLNISPASLKAVFLSNMNYFSQYKGKIFGLTGTLGSQAECSMLSEVFDVDFFRLPRFSRRFCLEEDPLLATKYVQWTRNVAKAAAAKVQLEKKRAVLIICDNIAAVEDIEKELREMDFKPSITTYTSSFDKDFKHAVDPGQIIVATNLAGRGTDLKVGEELEANGGLHVIISYLPPNTRVEAQAQGRTARAGQPGSYQFIVHDPNLDEHNDAVSELQCLKEARDQKESSRLDRIRTKGLPKINLEEELFNKFMSDVCAPITKMLKDLPQAKLKEKDCEKDYAKLQLDFLTSRWALWLEENGPHISQISSQDDKGELYTRFQMFRNESLDTCRQAGLLKFAKTPSELLLLGRYFESIKLSNTADQCYRTVINSEPDASEGACLYLARLILDKAENMLKKREAKKLLERSKDLMQRKLNILGSASEIVKFTIKLGKKSGLAVGQNRFQENIMNTCGLYNIHISAIDDLLSRTTTRSVSLRFSNEAEAKEVTSLLIDDAKNVCKKHRISKKRVTVEQTSKEKEGSNSINEHALYFEFGGIKKKIEWPSCWRYAHADIIQLIETRISSEKFEVEQSTFEGILADQKSLWEDLKKEGLLEKEGITSTWIIKVKEDVVIQLPDGLQNSEKILEDYLKERNGQPFDDSLSSFITCWSTDQIAAVVKLLKQNSEYLTEVIQLKGQLSDAIDRSSFILPASLKKYEDILSPWVEKTKTQDDGSACREDMPCPKDRSEAGKQLFEFLIGENIIKEPAVIFGNGKDLDGIKKKESEIQEQIKSLPKVSELCKKYRPVEDANILVSYSDYLSYCTAHPLDTAISGFFTVMAPSEWGTLPSSAHEKIKKWKTEQKLQANLDGYIAEITAAAMTSAGQLKTVAVPSASHRNIAEYYKTGRYPREITDFEDRCLDRVIILNEQKSLWDWRASVVLFIGVMQIVAGVALNILTAGLASPIANGLIAEGVGDIIFAVTAGLSGSISWQSYKSHKIFSVALTVATAGLGTYLTWGAGAAKGAQYAAQFGTKAGLSLLLAAGKQVAGRVWSAVSSAMITLGVQKLLEYLKTFIMDFVLEYIRSFIFSNPLWDLMTGMRTAMAKIWQLMKKAGRSVAEAKNKISQCLQSSTKTSMYGTWINGMTSKCNQIGNAMVSCFGQSTQLINGHESQRLISEGNTLLKNNDTRGNDPIQQGLNLIENTIQVVETAEKVTKLCNFIKNGTEVVTLFTHAPEYVHNINEELKQEIHNLNMQDKDDEISQDEQQKSTLAVKVESKEREQVDHQKSNGNQFIGEDEEVIKFMNLQDTKEVEEFNKFQKETEKKIQREVLDHVVGRIQSVWLQPFLQRKIEGFVQNFSQKAMKMVESLYEDPSDLEGIHKHREGDSESGEKDSEKEETADKFAEQDEGIKNSYKDQDGNERARFKSKEEFVDTIGNGRTATFLEMQLLADVTGQPIKIRDQGTGDFTPNSEDGTFTFHPKGKESSAEPICLDYSANEDGSKHISTSDGSDNAAPSGTANRCLYEAVAKVSNVGVEELIGQAKDYATHDDRADRLYKLDIANCLANIQPGARPPSTPDPNQLRPIVTTETTDWGERIVQSQAYISKDNLGKGTETNEQVRKQVQIQQKMEKQFAPDYDGYAFSGKVDAGHLFAKELGGSGTDMKNIVPMSQNLNRGEYRVAEEYVYSLVEQHDKPLLVTITCEYNNDSTVPSTITMHVQDNSGVDLFTKTFDNKQRGMADIPEPDQGRYEYPWDGFHASY